MSTKSRRRSRAVSRRRFMALLAGAALAASSARAVTMRTPPRPARRRAATRSAALEKGIAEQKVSLAKQLEILRKFPLPTGSDPAFLFHPLSPSRRIR